MHWVKIEKRLNKRAVRKMAGKTNDFINLITDIRLDYLSCFRNYKRSFSVIISIRIKNTNFYLQVINKDIL